MPRPFLIDTDTASDDAVAIIMALKWPDVDVKAITVVAGNMPLHQGLTNALYTSELCGSAVPVYAGAPKPMLRPHVDATWYHGQDGMGDQGYPAPTKQAEKRHAVDAMIDTIKANVEKIAHIQIADVPGRHEPGTGEINYPNVLKAIDESGYQGYVALEYVPAGDTQAGLDGWLPKDQRAVR